MTEIVSPTIEGEIRRADTVGWKGRHKVIAEKCTACGKLRWVMLRKLETTGLCVQCSGRRTIGFAMTANSKPRPYQSERQRGSNNPSWKGGVTKNGNGYRSVLMSADDPFYGMANKYGYVMEHRLVMARSLDRPLLATEQVHHINGIRTDNRIENLELWKKSHPSGVRQADYHCPGCRCFECEDEVSK